MYEYLKEAFAREDGTVSSAGILSAGGFAGERADVAVFANRLPNLAKDY